MNEIYIQSTKDLTTQPSLFYCAKKENMPLLVVLHTWSFDRFNQVDDFLKIAEVLDWNLLLPEFRGPNLKTNINPLNACGSELAKQDIIDATDYIKKEYPIDCNNIFLLGISGGGHMTMLMSAYRPNYYKMCIAACPVMDLEKWKRQNLNYSDHVDACCPTKESLLKRSPIYYIKEISTVNHLLIYHGKYDPSVPCSQSIDFYKSLNREYPKSKVFLNINNMGHEWNLNEIVSVLCEKASYKNIYTNDSISKASK